MEKEYNEYGYDANGYDEFGYSRVENVVNSAEDLILDANEDIYDQIMHRVEYDAKKDVTIMGIDYIYYDENSFELGYWNAKPKIESAPPLTAKTVMGSAPDKIEISSEMEM